ncbi:MAG: hypothetical protein LBP87_13420 [Planctomycetaceae bacterium]|jgi:hypothetical protein|nr:hypothetical protein [Planctomycetaceae bacterium]
MDDKVYCKYCKYRQRQHYGSDVCLRNYKVRYHPIDCEQEYYVSCFMANHDMNCEQFEKSSVLVRIIQWFSGWWAWR